MGSNHRRAQLLYVLLTALVMFPLGFSSAACCGSVCNRPAPPSIPPNLVCTERVPPTDPLEGSTFNDGFTDEQRASFIRNAIPSTVEVSVSRYTSADGVKNYGGSGVVVGIDHSVITAYHVIRDAEYVTVTYRSLDEDGLTISRGRTVPMQIIAVSQTLDVALLRPTRADEPNFPTPLPVDASWRPAVGAMVWQFGKTTRWSRGNILDIDSESADIEHVVETAFTVEYGDSGGPVLTPDGNIVGIILSKNSGEDSTREDDKGYFMPIHLVLDALHYRP